MKQRVRMGGIVLGIAALAFCADASAGLPWGKKKDESKKEDDKAKTEQAEQGPVKTVKGLHDIEGEIIGNPISGSKFGKLQIGMSQTQVNDMIGSAKECGSYMTGKAWIPFHFGSDNSRQECNYKGQGRLIFSNQANGSAYLLKIVYDANESGYR